MDIQENDPQLFFSLSIEGLNVWPASIFKEVSGISTNDHLHVTDSTMVLKSVLIPDGTGSMLFLKSGLIPIGSGMDLWCSATLEGDLSKPTVMHTLLLSLLAKDGQALKSWKISDAYIVSCKVSNDSPVAGQKYIESIEIAYNYFTVA
jgi:hypothetical protein